MEYSSKYCVCLLLLLVANVSDGRHLTDRTSDAATRPSNSLTQPRVAFPKKSKGDSDIARTVNERRATSKSVADTDVKTRAPLHTRPDELETDNKGTQQHVNTRPAPALHDDKPKRQLTGERNSVLSNYRNEKVNVNHVDTSEVISHDDISKDNISGKGRLRPDSTTNTRDEQHQNGRHIDGHVHRGSNSKIIDPMNENDNSKINDVSKESRVNSVQNENNSKVNHQTVKHDVRHIVSHSIDKPVTNDQRTESGNNPQGMLNSEARKINTRNSDTDTEQSMKSRMVNKDSSPEITKTINSQPNRLEKHSENGEAKESKTQGSNIRAVSKDTDDAFPPNVKSDADRDDTNNMLRPKVTVFIEEKNKNGHTQRVLASTGDGVVQSRPVHVSDQPLGNNEVSTDTKGIKSENNDENRSKNDIQRQVPVEIDPNVDGLQNSRGQSPIAVLEKAHDNNVPLKHVIEPAETNTDSMHNVDINEQTTAVSNQAVDGSDTTKTPTIPATEITTPAYERTTNNGKNSEVSKRTTTVNPAAVRKPQDVTPLDIFTSDIKYQRFPQPMSLTTFKNKVLGKRLKKLYILEESKKKLFQHVRQLEAIYTIEDGTLYVSFLFRFVYSRQCQEIQKFKMGKLVGNTDIALFEKEMKDGRTERILFFSERPEDYVFFMSCTDMKTSPYACRDSYYVTLDTAHDPPNQFPWADAARELESKLSITFEDPRFIFNFVLMPCARTGTAG